MMSSFTGIAIVALPAVIMTEEYLTRLRIMMKRRTQKRNLYCTNEDGVPAQWEKTVAGV